MVRVFDFAASISRRARLGAMALIAVIAMKTIAASISPSPQERTYSAPIQSAPAIWRDAAPAEEKFGKEIAGNP